MTRTEPLFQIRALCCALGQREILRDVTFNVECGESLAILGPNGAGKTTLLRALAGLVPYAGEALLLRRDVKSVSRAELARKITLVPQRLEYVPAFPVQAFLELSGELTEQVTSFAGVGALLERPLSTLSGGELQKVLLAGAVAQQAGVMLLDEPTASLDPRGRKMVTDALDELARKTHTTRIMVTHDVQLAVARCETILVMKEGSIVWKGASTDRQLTEVLSQAYECEFSSVPRPDGEGYILVPV